MEQGNKIEPMNILFTSYRDSVGLLGLKLSIDKHAPKHCSYPTLSYLVVPTPRNLTVVNMGRVCEAVLDNNWVLIQDFINEMYDIGIRQLIFCCWCTKDQIGQGRFCVSATIGTYMKAHGDEFKFKLEVDYGDGRELL